MSDHAESKGPKAAAPGLGLVTTDGVRERDDVSRGARFRSIRPAFVDDDPGGSRRPGYDDLIEGGVAVAALLAMMALDVTPWLAIPLSAVTYIAVTLLRPVQDDRDDVVGDPEPVQPGVEPVAGNPGRMQGPDGAPSCAGAVTTRFGLTRREQEVLPLLAQRLTDREIAEQLSISHRTAMNHTANILGKLGLASRRDVAAFVAQHALLPPSTPPHETE